MSGIRSVNLLTKDEKTLTVNIRMSDLSEGYLVMLSESDQVIKSLLHPTLSRAHKIFNGINEPFWE